MRSPGEHRSDTWHGSSLPVPAAKLQAMEYQRIEYYSSGPVLVVRFVPITERLAHFARQLRDELSDVAVRLRPRNIIVDFGSYFYWPIDTLGCLAHVKRAIPEPVTVRCVGMSLHLKAACEFLRFDAKILKQHDTVQAALDASEEQRTPAIEVVREAIDPLSHLASSPTFFAKSA
jgi:hypothetical protein